MITNHAYLDNPTFRGMRQSLLKTFDEIYILDLHGNSLKKETAPDGSRDENIFKIRVGVAIAFFVKYGQDPPASFTGKGLGSEVQDAPALPSERESEGRVYYADLYGTRKEKYDYLSTHDITTTHWQPITPTSPFYFFVPRQNENLEAYRTWPSVLEIFPVNSTGVKTHRDSFAIAFDRVELQNRVVQLQNSHGLPDEILSSAYGLQDTGSWSLSAARKKVQADLQALDKIYPILYRPFDVLHIFYHEAIVGGLRYEVMRHMLAGENLALCVGRQGQVVGPGEWTLAFCAKYIVDHNLFYRGGNVTFPLYLYPDVDSSGTLSGGRQVNIESRLLAAMGEAYGEEPVPEDVLAYVYAVLYSPTYRERYAVELRVNFPRVPFTTEGEAFRRMAALGRRLIALHLLDSLELHPPAIRYEGEGPDIVERVRYDAATQRVCINTHKYFTGVTPEMWAYRIGGYQVLEKYLKDRRGRTIDDPVRYLYIGTAIARTIALQKEIDAVYQAIEAATGEGYLTGQGGREGG